MLFKVFISFRFRTGERKVLLCIPTRDVRRFKMGSLQNYGFGIARRKWKSESNIP